MPVNAFGPPVAWAAVCSKAVVLPLLIYCFMYLPLCVCVGGGGGGGSELVCFGMHYFMSFLVLQSS